MDQATIKQLQDDAKAVIESLGNTNQPGTVGKVEKLALNHETRLLAQEERPVFDSSVLDRLAAVESVLGLTQATATEQQAAA